MHPRLPLSRPKVQTRAGEFPLLHCHRLDFVCPPCAKFAAILSENASADAWEEQYREFLTLLPQDSVVDFEVNIPDLERALAAMLDIEMLYLVGVVVREKLLPSLQQLYLEDADWSTLAHQTSGNQAVSLAVLGRGVHVCLGVMGRSELVEELVYQPDTDEIVPLIRACGGVDNRRLFVSMNRGLPVQAVKRTSPRRPTIHVRLTGRDCLPR